MKKLLVAEEGEGRVISQDEEGCRPIVKMKRMQLSASEMEEWQKPLSSEDFAEEDTEGWIKCDFLFCTMKRYKMRERLMREKRLKQNTLSHPIDVYSRTDAAANEKQENSKGGPKSKQSRGCVRAKKKASDVFEMQSVRLIDEERQEPTQTMIKRPRKAAVRPPEPDREIPQDVKNKIIEGLGGSEILFVCEKHLTKSDCDRNEHRLMMTEKMISWLPSFLSDDEKEFLKIRGEKNKLNEIPVEMLEPTLNTCRLALRRWEMKKPGKSSSVAFVLADGWNDVVARNGLNVGDHVEVWSFRRLSQLCLALITTRN
ncbi:putative B3 domain-containing protein At2g27410 [Punica granatum]|uniref:B3 domain-containing protein At2g27410 n=2 Tax=Punica granatum TaxID=22663 RepID=A0A6P8BTF0_PUNGR|nr:putative B3 domain-containing protein At2g27410 [Punica granatum]PKI53215.1 hypothetical protein CRG98_026416 [Punica granatum]